MTQSIALSPQSMNNASFAAINKVQRQLADAQTELACGHHANLDEVLGWRAGASVSMRNEQAHMDAVKSANAVVRARLGGSQAALTTATETVQTLLGELVSSASGQTDMGQLVQRARDGLKALAGAANTQIDGIHVFAGTRTETPPLADYVTTPPSAAATAVGSAFQTAFGTTQSGAGVGALADTAVKGYLDTTFAGLFADASWQGVWSQASDAATQAQISPSVTVDVSVTANEPGFRDAVRGLVMIADLGVDQMNPKAQATVVAAATGALTSAISGFNDLQTRIGSTEAALTAADDRIDASSRMLTKLLSDREDVDPTELSTRIAQLTTKLEAAYAMTARLQRLSLVDALR